MKAIFISILLLVLVTSPPPSGSTFTLTFEYAARQKSPFETSLANVVWNNDIILSVVPTDYDLHTATVDVTAIVGANILQFEGAGASDGVGLDFTNVALIQQGDLTNTNVLVNGDFSQPNLNGGWSLYNSIPGWTGLNIEIGNGQDYGTVWSNTTQLVELDAYSNFQITQILTFDSNFQVISTPSTPSSCKSSLFQQVNFTIQFDWAPNTVGTNNLLTSQANILWNNNVLDSLVPTNTTEGVNHASYTVIASLCDQNYLQFDGTDESDGFGMSISNVQLTVTSSISSTNLLNGAWTAANPEFADCSTFNSAWSTGQCFSLDSGTNQRYTQSFTVPAPTTPQKAFDIVGPLTKTAFGCLVQQGYTYVSVRIDSSTPGALDPTTIQTLQNAQAAGLQTAIYQIVCPSQTYYSQFYATLITTPPTLYTNIWFKLIENTPECSWQGFTNTTTNCQSIMAILQISMGMAGAKVGIYTTKAIWNNLFGQTCPIGQLGAVYLWYSDYQSNGIVDPTESFSDFTADGGFGGWTQPDLKTTVGTTHVTLCNNPAWHALINIDWHP